MVGINNGFVHRNKVTVIIDDGVERVRGASRNEWLWC